MRYTETKLPRKSKKMTQKEFLDYLFEWLRFESGEDVCAKCAVCPKDRICPNADRDSIDFDYNTCLWGVKAYAEKHRTD